MIFQKKRTLDDSILEVLSIATTLFAHDPNDKSNAEPNSTTEHSSDDNDREVMEHPLVDERVRHMLEHLIHTVQSRQSNNVSTCSMLNIGFSLDQHIETEAALLGLTPRTEEDSVVPLVRMGDQQRNTLKMLIRRSRKHSMLLTNQREVHQTIGILFLWLSNHNTVLPALQHIADSIAAIPELQRYTAHVTQQAVWLHMITAFGKAVRLSEFDGVPWGWAEPLLVQHYVQSMGDTKALRGHFETVIRFLKRGGGVIGNYQWNTYSADNMMYNWDKVIATFGKTPLREFETTKYYQRYRLGNTQQDETADTVVV